jgi:hypothetical protein
MKKLSRHTPGSRPRPRDREPAQALLDGKEEFKRQLEQEIFIAEQLLVIDKAFAIAWQYRAKAFNDIASRIAGKVATVTEQVAEGEKLVADLRGRLDLLKKEKP